MVFESIVTDIINRVLGNYVENLDSKQLKIGIWGGDVVLHNLKLRQNALDDLDLPVKIIYGHLGKLVLKIPWKNLYKQPVVVEIEDLYVLVCPSQAVQYNEEKEIQYELQTKEAELQKIEIARKLELEKDKPKQDKSFTEKLTAQIVDNLQIKISNVHVRFEDNTTSEIPFAVGITLFGLDIYTTDADWNKCYIAEGGSQVFKVTNLDSLSIYMNCKTSLFIKKDTEIRDTLFKENIATKDYLPENFSYVLGPITSLAKLQLNMNPEYNDPPFEIPKIYLTLEMLKLNIQTTRIQFQNIMKLVDSLDRMRLGVPYRKYRPFNIGYRGHYKEWWKFAITCILETDIRRKKREWSWEHIIEYRRLMKSYIEAYIDKMTSKNPCAESLETCTLGERKLNLVSLKLIRNRAQYELDKIKEKQKSNHKKSWISFGWWSGAQQDNTNELATDLAKRFEDAMTAEEKEKLYQAIGYEKDAIQAVLPEEYTAIKLNFVLGALEISVRDELVTLPLNDSKSVDEIIDFQSILLFKLKLFTCEISQRPAANAFRVKAGVKEFTVYGFKKENHIPTLIESQVPDMHNLLDIDFQTNPIEKTCDQSLKVLARPLEITYDAETIIQLAEFFKKPKAVDLAHLEDAAAARLSNIKERSATGMHYLLEKHERLEVEIKCMPTILIFPYGGMYLRGHSSVIVVSLGIFSIVSEPRPKDVGNVQEMHEQGRNKSEILQEIMERSYDRFKLKIANVQILVAKPQENWHDITSNSYLTELHILSPASFILNAELCVIEDDPRLPKTKIQITLPSIGINASEERIYDAISIITSIPFPQQSSVEPMQLSKGMTASSVSLMKFLETEKDKMAKKAVSKVDISSEIIQYTNLELSFTLKELSIAIYKAKDHETSSEVFTTPLTEFSIEKFDSFGSFGPSDHEKVLFFQIIKLEAALACRTYEMVAEIKLGAIKLNEYDNWDDKEDIIKIIDTPQYNDDHQYLFSISYINANKISPEFMTKYNSTEQQIVVNFSTLCVTLHQEGLQKLLIIAHQFQNKIENLERISEHDRLGSAVQDDNIFKKIKANLETIEEEPLNTKSTHSKTRYSVVDSVKIKLVANLDQVSIMLTCRKRPIANLKVQYFNVGAILKSSYTELTLKLKNILVTDLNPITYHPEILSVIGENAIYCQVVLFNLDETVNYNTDDMKISLTMGCVKIFFLNWFVTTVLTFLGNFQEAQKAIAEAGTAAADAAKESVVDAYSKATRIKFNIKLKAPLIIVPVDSRTMEGIALDLGFLSITNYITENLLSENYNSPYIMDHIKLELREMKLSKVKILETHEKSITSGLSLKESDLLYGLDFQANILDSISFTLNVQRNLSSSWFKEKPEMDISGRLHTIEIMIFLLDYYMFLSLLSKNLKEGQGEFNVTNNTLKIGKDLSSGNEVPKKPQPKIITEKLKNFGETNKIDVILKFSFQIDGLIVHLKEIEQNLATFGLYYLSIRGNKLADGTLNTSIVLCDVQLDDSRPSSEGKITKFLKRKLTKVIDKKAQVCENTKSMLDIVANFKGNETFAEIRVCGFDLIISLDFLAKIGLFFHIPKDEGLKNSSDINLDDLQYQDLRFQDSNNYKKTNQTTTDTKTRISLIVHWDEPEIILVESMENTNANAIVFNWEMILKVRMLEEKQLVHGEIKELKMYMCMFQPERREATKHYIIHPCSLSVQGSTPEDRGLNISLKLSEVVINISPATIELINKAILTLTSTEERNSLIVTHPKKFSKIWGVKDYKDEEFWFLKAEEAFEALEIENLGKEIESKPETCIIEIPSIVLVVETGVGYYTTPMIYFETRMNATVHDWSKQMKINGTLTLSTSYYNSAHAVWEPIIEQNERFWPNEDAVYGPWELNFDFNIETKKSDEPEKNEIESIKRIYINSKEILEITFSKTCFDNLQLLGQSFSQAFDVSGLIKPDVIAPYIVENDTGFDITINLSKGPFTLHECHMPNTKTLKDDNLNKFVIFKTNKSVANIAPEDVTSCKISAGGKVYLQLKNALMDQAKSAISILSYNSNKENFVLHVEIGDIKKDIALPIRKVDQRYFPLYHDTNQEPWGIISEVKSEYGATIVNIHGVVKVKNHFSTTVNVYRIRNENSIFIGTINPGTTFNVPLHAIYSKTKDLYFSLPGYERSVQGINWKDCPTDLNYTKNLQCDPMSTFEPFYIKAVREKTEVFHEISSKYTLLSAFYTIHLRPPLYLRNALPIDMVVSVAGCSYGVQKGVEVQEQTKALNKEDFLDYGEKVIKPGDVLHLPTVKLTSKGGEAKSYVVLRLIQYLEKNWSCTTEISEIQGEFAVWTFTSYDSVDRMDIELGVRFENRHGSLMLTVYCPFWMINKTGLMLSYRVDDESINVLYHPPDYNGPILFSFREKLFFGKKRASVRVDNGEWSQKIPLDVAGSSGVVQCKANNMTYEIGVHNHLTDNSLTKQITFVPLYVLINKAYFTIEVQEEYRSADPWTKIEPDECVPLWPKAETKHMLKARIPEYDHISRPFKYTDVQCTLLMMKNKFGGINVDVQVTEGGVYITFTEYHSGDAPGLIINHTKRVINFWEKGNVNKRTLKPHQKMLYAWADPAGYKQLLWDDGNTTIENDLRKDGVDEFQVSGEDSDIAYWVSFLDGTQRVLLFTDQIYIANDAQSASQLEKINTDIEISIYGIGLSVLNNIKSVDILYLGVASSGVIWESKKKTKTRFKQMKISEINAIEQKYQEFLLHREIGDFSHKYFLEDDKYEINFVQMQLLKSHERDIRRTFYPGLWLNLKTSPYQTQIHAKINRIQIDNQLSDCIFPVVLAPVSPPKSIAATTALKPFIECSVVERVIPHSTVKQFKYCCMLIQEFHVKVDLQFITELADMFSKETTDEEAAKLFYETCSNIEKPLSALVATQTQQEQKNFYDNFHLGPLKIHVSFSMAGSESTALPSILATILQGVGVTLTDINDVVFRLAFFEREYQFFTQRQLISEVVTHYTGQAVKQLYVLVLGLDVLGNPYGLVVGLTKGVEDLFYEPFQGAIQGPGEFAEGLVLGVKSLFGHTVGGAAGAVSKITGAMGKGLAALTFDKDYQRKRREALNKKPTNFQEGIARSGKGLVMGVFDGVTGVFTKPISGAKEQGVEGFFKGLGKGAVGLVARPTAGVVDFASGSFEAVKRATETTEDVNRLRPPRFLHSDGVLQPYSLGEAQGNKLLKEIEKGKYARTDTFCYFVEIIPNREAVLVSNHRIFYTIKNELFGYWTTQWVFSWNDIAMVRSNERGVEITLKGEGKKILGLFSSSEAHKKLILLSNKAKRDNLAKIIDRLCVSSATR